ncbi:hypothetical protein LDENG_00032730 [Lucifuga dentata]|nr:hypothetical protein LDENG_00032730 [Lucifuga dentata]
MLAQWLALSPHSEKVPGSSLNRSFCVELACSPRVCVGFLRLPPKTCMSGELETLT